MHPKSTKSSKVSKGYLKVQGFQKVPIGPRYPIGTQRFKVSKKHLRGLNFTFTGNNRAREKTKSVLILDSHGEQIGKMHILIFDQKWLKYQPTIPRVHANTIIPCLYHESMSIPWVHVYMMSPCQFHTSMSIPLVRSNYMSQCIYHESRNSNYRNKHIKEIQISEMLK